MCLFLLMYLNLHYIKWFLKYCDFRKWQGTWSLLAISSRLGTDELTVYRRGIDELLAISSRYGIDELPAISSRYGIDESPAISNRYVIDELPAISSRYDIDELPAMAVDMA